LFAPLSRPIDDNMRILMNLEDKYKWAAVWELIVDAILDKSFDSRIHVSIQILASLLGLSLDELSIAEQECAALLQRQLIEMRRLEEENPSKNRMKKIGAGVVVGGGVAFVCGLLVLPLLVPALAGAVALGAGAAIAIPVAGSAISAGILAAGSIAILASPALPFVFGATGAGLIGIKVAHITEGISEFYFKRVPISIQSKTDQPEERFYLDLTNKRVVDMHTGEIHVNILFCLFLGPGF
jgi:hypothetical protein